MTAGADRGTNPLASADDGTDASEDLAVLADRLHSLSIRLLRTVRTEDAATGLSAPRLSVLAVLAFGGARPMGALAAAEQVTAPTMTRLVQALAADGLVERRADPADARQVLVRVTASGRRLVEGARRRRVAVLVGRLGELPPTARTDVVRAVEALEGVFGVRPGGPSG